MTLSRDGRRARAVLRGLLAMTALSSGCGKAAEEEKPEPASVRTAVAEEGAITEWIELQGKVAPPYDRDATLAPLVPGRIVFLAARVGDMVTEGAVVARVETGALDDQLKAAEAAARRSEADVAFKRSVAKRSRDLVAKGVASREEVESADAAAVAAESAQAEDASNLATARRRRSWSEVTAPFTGVIVRVDRRIGDFVDGTAATPVAEVAATDGWEIVASATSVTLQRLRAGQAAAIAGLGAPTDSVAAAVTGIARAVDPSTGAGDVRLRPLSRPSGTALGSPVQVRVAVQSHPKAILVPKAALRMSPDGTAEVVVVEKHVAHVRKVETGLTEMDRVELISGVAAGAHVVIEDPVGIADGAALKEESEGEDKSPKDKEPAARESPGEKK
ncbi:MAG: efflux RND transporter periplasmic adaptor subunit [Vicinamibacteria bacterium]|nr:efflux RND transporter periplasmic adaptor subunit [Vicinamibacteria bacterium]